MNRIRQSGPSCSGPRGGWTLLELLVLIAVVTFLGSLLLVGFQQVLEESKKTQCIGNLRQIGVGLLTYAAEHDGYMPNQLPGGQGNPTWHYYLRDYLGWGNHGTSTRLGNCPAHPRMSNNNQFIFKRSYAMNSSYTPSFWQSRRVLVPQEAFLVGENRPDSEARRIVRPGQADIGFEHNERANFLFLDGHVESRTLEEIPPGSENNRPHYIRFWQPLNYQN